MAHIALYRSWRPQAFRDVVGQKHIVQTLQNSLKEGRLSHAYLFSGPRGTGKTTLAKIVAKAVNCENGPGEEPCNDCEACRRITEGSVIDVMEIDAASNRGVEEIRDLRDKVKYAPTEVRRKVYIIDEVHMLTTEAFNALLKTLEEPPAHVMFILATTEPHKLPATIISRCQRFDLRRVPLEEQVERLQKVCEEEHFTADKEALHYIARLSDGGMRDALSLLDQIASFSDNRITYETAVSITGGIASEQFSKLAQSIRNQDIGTALGVIEGFMREGKSADKCMESLIHYFRDLLMIRMVPKAQAVTERILNPESFREMAEAFAPDDLFRMIEILNHYQSEMKFSAQPQTMFEVAVMKACAALTGGPSPEQGRSSTGEASSEELGALRQKVVQLEQQLTKLLQNGVAAASPAPASKQSPAARTPSPASAARRSGIKLDGYVKQQGSDLFKQVLMKWSQVLAQVKDRKITVHAWLVDGEPVSMDQDNVLLAFKSAMHRETTERPANKQLIEQVISEIMGHPMQFVTVMQKEWKEAQEGASEEAPEEMKLEAEEPGRIKEDWIHEAIQLFGEDLVKIKEE
ncbi:DNA polymerase III subunit gamma/tau [Paenibacillus aurantius]|uniref:DNA-directed DNA polymerase n=1 Tax=Paenibacillus aurantius TaxID=2918900 RepID=A0AA96LGF2_9BACL|nr:DNA polymerase III subunit gamma/tau [Paenibacillus aurantius]WNQ11042.1 DNA polymerase III subunit gamma/tau [Paenibacillus aurantius]